MKYEKLVRDLIPDIIRAKGENPIVETLDDDAYRTALAKKLIEEGVEFQEKPSLEELADVMEVVDAALVAHGWTHEQLAAVQNKKRDERGGFAKKIFLIEA